MPELRADQAQRAAFTNAVAQAHSLSHGNRAGEEPAYRWLADPPAKQVVTAYLEQLMPPAGSPADPLPIFSIELPSLTRNRLPLAVVLSRVLGLSVRGKWRDSYFAEQRLGAHLRARQVECVILTDAHQLLKRPHSVEWLVYFFRQYVSDVPLVLVGEGKQMEELLLWKATAWVVRRFHRISLPGEPEPPGDAGSRVTVARCRVQCDSLWSVTEATVIRPVPARIEAGDTRLACVEPGAEGATEVACHALGGRVLSERVLFYRRGYQP